METTAAAQITGADMMEYCREFGLKGSDDYQLAMYVRGIITESELLAATSVAPDAIMDSIKILSSEVAAWIES